MNPTGNNLKHITIHAHSAEANSVGNIRALLAEIAARLDKLLQLGETGSIDLNSLPLAPGEYEQLRQALGQGEVSARIEVIGPSEIIETHYPGVWWGHTLQRGRRHRCRLDRDHRDTRNTQEPARGHTRRGGITAGNTR